MIRSADMAQIISNITSATKVQQVQQQLGDFQQRHMAIVQEEESIKNRSTVKDTEAAEERKVEPDREKFRRYSGMSGKGEGEEEEEEEGADSTEKRMAVEMGYGKNVDVTI